MASRETKFSPPPAAEFAHLRPSNWQGIRFVTWTAGLTVGSIALSTSDSTLIWITGQILLSLALLQWFVTIHEAGHKTLFQSPQWNRYIGHVASFFAVIPFACWKTVHAVHHRWTGWQDRDATTETLVPRRLSLGERCVINTCWRLWIPLFAVLYRWNNYWNLRRLGRLFPPRKHGPMVVNVWLLLAVYTATVCVVGWAALLKLAGLGLLLSLVMQDLLILSQHTHIPMKVSHGAAVQPFAPSEQLAFTRSLRFPMWFSTLFLLNMDAHELHHLYSHVPGYHLRKIDYSTENTVSWWRWTLSARRLPADVLLFQNRDQTGFHI